MSSLYVLEPPTRGKVILNTSEGPLDIELWPKEAPKAVRNFVQLCMEGYYDNTTFHRIISTFMVQGGDRTGTGTGGESIYGAPFADEFHSRLRFNHRALVACANAGTPNSNNSQFFITLDRCDWLDRKNTIFGKVTGDTVYNLLKLGNVETGADDRPLEPPVILSTEVLWCPFDDIIPRQSIQAAEPPSEDKDTKSKTKKKKELNLLSFGEEAQEEEEELASTNVKMKSSHDVLDDPRLLKGDIEHVELLKNDEKRKELQASVREALSTKKKGGSAGDLRDSDNSDNTSDEEDKDFDAAMRRQVLDKIKKFDEGRISKKSAGGKNSSSEAGRTLRDNEDEDISTKHEKLSLKRKGLGSEARAGLLLKVDVDAQLLAPAEQQRHLHKQKKRARQGREQATLEKLKQFQNNLAKAKMESSSKNASGEEDKEGDSGWLAHQLKFVTDKHKDKMARNNDLDQYVVHDPLLEKGKEKFNKLQAKLKRREREWAGKSLT